MKSKWIAIVMTLIMVVSLTACGSSGDGSQSSGSGGKETLVVVTWGGELETALKKAAEGFEEANNCTLQWESAPDYSKVKAMVDAGDVQWDVMSCDSDFAFRGGKQGFWKKWITM